MTVKEALKLWSKAYDAILIADEALDKALDEAIKSTNNPNELAEVKELSRLTSRFSTEVERGENSWELGMKIFTHVLKQYLLTCTTQ